MKPVGRMVLNSNPDNFFAETEQVAFCTAHVVPGIDFSNDPLLHGRIHSYTDTQISRLGGANFHEIPINAPLAPVHNNQRDGMHRQAIARGSGLRAQLARRRLPLPGGREGLRVLPEGHRGGQRHRQSPGQAGAVRGTLQSSHAFLRKPDRRGTGSHRRRLSLRAQQSDGARHPRADGLLASQRVGGLASRVAEGLGIELPDPMPRATNRRSSRR